MHENYQRGGAIMGGAGYAGNATMAAQAQMCADKLGETMVRREVPTQMERLEKAVCYAEDSLRELSARLEHVLRPTGPEPVGAGACVGAPGPSTAHGGHLYHLGTRAGNLGQDIQDLLLRLEV